MKAIPNNKNDFILKKKAINQKAEEDSENLNNKKQVESHLIDDSSDVRKKSINNLSLDKSQKDLKVIPDNKGDFILKKKIIKSKDEEDSENLNNKKQVESYLIDDSSDARKKSINNLSLDKSQKDLKVIPNNKGDFIVKKKIIKPKDEEDSENLHKKQQVDNHLIDDSSDIRKKNINPLYELDLKSNLILKKKNSVETPKPSNEVILNGINKNNERNKLQNKSSEKGMDYLNIISNPLNAIEKQEDSYQNKMRNSKKVIKLEINQAQNIEIKPIKLNKLKINDERNFKIDRQSNLIIQSPREELFTVKTEKIYDEILSSRYESIKKNSSKEVQTSKHLLKHKENKKKYVEEDNQIS